MKVTATELPDVLFIEPLLAPDERGVFSELWQADRYAQHGIRTSFVQDNVSTSRKGVVRGLHFQNPRGQVKLVTVLSGQVYDVAVDVRISSPTFGQWTARILTGERREQLFIPAGFAHGFQVISDTAVFLYKCGSLYDPAAERAIRWSDPALAIPWPIEPAIVSTKDSVAPLLADLPSEATTW